MNFDPVKFVKETLSRGVKYILYFLYFSFFYIFCLQIEDFTFESNWPILSEIGKC